MKKSLLFVAVFMFTAAAFTQSSERHQFTSAISDREPNDVITSYKTSLGTSIYYFSELSGLVGEVVKHCWYKNDEIVHNFIFNVNGTRWRVNSSMKADHFKAGDVVTVEIKDSKGKVYATDKLTIE